MLVMSMCEHYSFIVVFIANMIIYSHMRLIFIVGALHDFPDTQQKRNGMAGALGQLYYIEKLVCIVSIGMLSLRFMYNQVT